MSTIFTTRGYKIRFKGVLFMMVLRLKEFRKNARLTQSDVADALKMTQAGYSLLELGKRVTNTNQIITMCELFNCSPNDLFGYKEKTD